MIHRAFVLLGVFMVLPIVAKAQGSPPENRLVVLNFEPNGNIDAFEHLQRELPDALEAILFEYTDVLRLVERDELGSILEEVEYQYDNISLFNDSTIALLGKIHGANLVLIGKIGYRAEELTISVKVVHIETSEVRGRGFKVVRASDLSSSTQLIPQMQELGSCLVRQLKEEPISCVFAGAESIDDIGELATSLAEGLAANRVPGPILVAPFTESQTGQFSEFSNHFKNLLETKIRTGANLEVITSFVPETRPTSSDVALEYGERAQAAYVLTGTYTQEGADWYRFLASLRRISDRVALTAPEEMIRASVIDGLGISRQPEYNLECWNLPCPDFRTVWTTRHYVVPGLGLAQERSGLGGGAWIGASLLAAVGIGVGLQLRSEANSKLGTARTSDQINHYRDRITQGERIAIASGVILVSSYLINTLWLKMQR